MRPASSRGTDKAEWARQARAILLEISMWGVTKVVNFDLYSFKCDGRRCSSHRRGELTKPPGRVGPMFPEIPTERDYDRPVLSGLLRYPAGDHAEKTFLDRTN